MSRKIDFDPIKEDKDGVKAKRMIWSTKALDLAIKGLGEGRKLVANPFYENNIKLLKGDLVFQRTPEEVAEWKKCKKDIHYFVEKYCKLMTPEGIKHITLRDYQHKYLDHLDKNQLSVYLACRQCGKCLSFNELIKVKLSNNVPLNNRLKKYLINNYHIKEDDCYELPLFELYNLYDNSFLWKLKYNIYKLIYKLEKDGTETRINILYKILELLNKKSDDKIIRSHLMDDVLVWTDEGWATTSYIHMTKPFQVYEIVLEDGLRLRCADEHILFYQNYKEVYAKNLQIGNYVMTEYGLKKVLSITQTSNTLNMCDITVHNSHESYYTNHILSHNTTTTCIYLLHYLLFNIDKNALICANILKTAKEIIDKTKKIFVELPFFLKPGIYKWNESEIVLDNGCRVQCTSTTGTSGIGFTINMLVLDELAHLAPNIADKFYNNIFPTVIASKAKVAITSTQNGRNLFYRIYKAAEAGESDYKSFKTDWYEVPEWNPDKKCWEKRDEEWHRRQVANYGSEEAFNSQFGTNFDISSNTLISQKILSKLSTSLVEFINKEIPGVIAGDSFYWHPNFDPSTLKQNHIIITGDLSEGVERDYTVFMISRMIEPESGKLECVGFFRSNSLSRETCALAIQTLICKYCDLDKVLLSYERNTYGDLFYKQLIENAEKDPLVSNFDESIIVKYFNETGTKFNRGIKITSGNKTVHCKLFKEDFERGLITNDSLQTSIELGNFNDDGTGHYKAVFGHDDLVMTMVQLTFVKNTLQYKMMKSDFDSQIEPQQSQQDSNYDVYAESWGEDIYDLDVKGNVGRLNRFINQL